MGRKKKVEKEEIEEEEIKEIEKEPFLDGDAKRSIVAIALFVFAALFALGYMGVAGVFGNFLDETSGSFLGWGKWIFPPVLVTAGVFLLKRKQSSLAEFLKFFGLTLAFVSLLGFFHFFVGGDMEKAAKEGLGGGYVGYALASFLKEFTGMIAGILILLALLATGLIVSFNLSIMAFVNRWAGEAQVDESDNAEEGEEIEGEEYADESEDDVEYEEVDVESDDEEIAESASNRNKNNAATVEKKGLFAFFSRKKNSKAKVEAVEEVKEDKEKTALEAENIGAIRFVGDEEEVLSEDESNLEDRMVFEGEDDEAEYEEDGEIDEDEEGVDSEEGEGYEDEVDEIEEVPVKPKKVPKPQWKMPSVDLLDKETAKTKGTKNEQNAFIIQKTLKHFGIDVELGEIQTGPTVTQYTFRPTAGIKLSRITALSSDLALALAAPSIRIEAPIPGKSLVGIEVPNRSSAIVRMKNVLLDGSYTGRDGNLMVVLGQDVMGGYVLGDLRKMPHLLVAGATNSGKSVCINTILLSLLYQNTPEDLKMILVDPKRVELSLYNKIPHLLTDVIVENKKVVNVLRWAVSEMERRYKLLQEVGSRDLESYKRRCERKEKRTIFDERTGKRREEELELLPYIVIVIDEMADLMMGHGKDVESLVVRLAQMSRAVGIHLILATQRPSVEVLTGLIKANITTRIAFQVATQIDSRTILDQGGAEKLLGRGDMLYLSTGSNQPRRLQGVFVSEDEVHRVVDFLKKQRYEVGNEEDLMDDISGSSKGSKNGDVSYLFGSAPLSFDEHASGGGASEDDLYDEARAVVIQAKKASASLLQRRLRVGYSRAARLIDLLEDEGVVGPADGAKPREVYVSADDEDENDDNEMALRDQERRDRWDV